MVEATGVNALIVGGESVLPEGTGVNVAILRVT
jgi:hypothetical protein